jgi:tRNA modification GTPase
MRNDMLSDTTVRVALLTPAGRGALAVVGIAGPHACAMADACFRPRGPLPLAARMDAAICFGRWVALAGSPGEDLVVVRHSTDRLEVHCHGGDAASEAVIASLERQGAMRQAWPDWLRDAGMNPIEGEARVALASVAGPRAARILARQAAGLLRAEISRLMSLAPAERIRGVERLLAASRVGLRLADPWRIVLVGPVNAGKSSLANAIAGHARSIVSPEPGTTRDLVTTRLVLGGWDVELVDTAGLRAADAFPTPTEQAGIARTEGAAVDADLVLRIMPADEPTSLFMPVGPTELCVVTKADLVPDAFEAPERSILTSAVTGRGIAELAAAIMATLVPETHRDPSLLEGPVPFTERQVAMIRSLCDSE